MATQPPPVVGTPVPVPPRTMRVQCPPGVTAGQFVQFNTPDNGQMQVQIPHGITAGTTFEVQLPEMQQGSTAQQQAPTAMQSVGNEIDRVTPGLLPKGHQLRFW